MKNNSGFGNIGNIKSKKILKTILFFIIEYKKLDLFKYNKNCQKELSLDLEDYLNVSQKEIKIENNNNGKEYILGSEVKIFEGEFLHGKRNGKGKEYYINGNLKFEGEYLKGKKIKGKGYDIKGKLILELNNKEGKEYYDNGKLKFIGEYYDGRRWNGNIFNYQGKKINEVKYGKWEVNNDNRNKTIYDYEGKYLNGLKEGEGKEYNEKLKLIFKGHY